MGFLYFPEDKSLYIPAFLTLLIFVIGAILAMYLIKKVSKKEAQKADEKYKEYKND